jgi:hypothetical protein
LLARTRVWAAALSCSRGDGRASGRDEFVFERRRPLLVAHPGQQERGEGDRAADDRGADERRCTPIVSLTDR